MPRPDPNIFFVLEEKADIRVKPEHLRKVQGGEPQAVQAFSACRRQACEAFVLKG